MLHAAMECVCVRSECMYDVGVAYLQVVVYLNEG